MSGLTRKEIQRKLKMRGNGLKIDALDEIPSFVNRFSDAEHEAIDLLLDQLEHESSLNRVISVLLEAQAAAEDDSGAVSAIGVIDAFLVPKFRYDSIQKHFYQHTASLPIHSEASVKAALYRDRFLLLFQRVSHDQHFSRPSFDVENSEFGSCETLVGQTGKRWVMGVISQLEDGHFYLEDLMASVEIDLSKAKITTVFFFTENTIVVAEGEMLVDGIFQVITCGFPPLEGRDQSLKLLAGHDFFRGGTLTKEDTLRLADLEKKAVSDIFVILSDIWLDNEEFGKLGQMIAAHPRLKEHSRFLFIPGPDAADVLYRNILLRSSENTSQMPYFRNHVLHPRNRVCSPGSSVRMRRSCLVLPSMEETDDPFEHLVATITHQSHLCPLPLMVQPIIWNYDHSLHLYPTPHGIVLGDKSEQKAFKYTGITCFNPGSFSSDST